MNWELVDKKSILSAPLLTLSPIPDRRDCGKTLRGRAGRSPALKGERFRVRINYATCWVKMQLQKSSNRDAAHQTCLPAIAPTTLPAFPLVQPCGIPDEAVWPRSSVSPQTVSFIIAHHTSKFKQKPAARTGDIFLSPSMYEDPSAAYAMCLLLFRSQYLSRAIIHVFYRNSVCFPINPTFIQSRKKMRRLPCLGSRRAIFSH